MGQSGTPTAGQEGLKWVSGADRQFTVNGLWWFEENGREFLRLPKRAKDKLRPELWGLVELPSGGRIRFKTDTTTLKAKIRHDSDGLAMHHMSSVGCNGIDLYEGPPGRETFWASTKPEHPKEPYLVTYFEGIERRMHEFTLYLPVYGKLASIELGLDQAAVIEPPSRYRLAKPVVVYGTSITQGGCSSRGGTGFVPAIGRMLGVDVINLGFSGNGRCEPAMAELVRAIDAACYVIDPVANMAGHPLSTRNAVYLKFVQIIREKRRAAPMVLMTRVRYASENYMGSAGADELNGMVDEAYKKLKGDGDDRIYYFDSRKVVTLGGDHPSVDGGHLSDVGFKFLADALAPLLAEILGLACRDSYPGPPRRHGAAKSSSRR